MHGTGRVNMVSHNLKKKAQFSKKYQKLRNSCGLPEWKFLVIIYFDCLWLDLIKSSIYIELLLIERPKMLSKLFSKY